MGFWQNQILFILVVILVGSCSLICDGHEHYHKCNHHHHHHESDDHHIHQSVEKAFKLPEEIAEEEYLEKHGFGSSHQHTHNHDHNHDNVVSELSGAGLWFQALGCSLLVSMASLICLVILPIIFIQGKPSKTVVDALALFGAGAMLGDAFLHQLPHAFGGEHSESDSYDHHMEQDHHHAHGHGHSHSHSLKDLSVGLSILGGIVLFLIVEKIVRYVEEYSGGNDALGHVHHHHHHHTSNKKSEDKDDDASLNTQFVNKEIGNMSELANETSNEEKRNQLKSLLRKRSSATDGRDEKTDLHVIDGTTNKSVLGKEPAKSPSNLVFGYLNLFSDGVHNFTDGMALGSAFLLYGSVGGWSRTLFLLAHELPQEVGDFGILVRSGFSVSKALFFNFLSALVALAGTALALLVGQSPGQSSIIEGFTAGGFIYIAVAGVLAEMNNNGSTKLKSMTIQLVSLILGMAVALCISLVE